MPGKLADLQVSGVKVDSCLLYLPVRFPGGSYAVSLHMWAIYLEEAEPEWVFVSRLLSFSMYHTFTSLSTPISLFQICWLCEFQVGLVLGCAELLQSTRQPVCA